MSTRSSYRTHSCGELRANHDGKEVTLSGWVHSLRDHGGVVFIDLRDRYGRTQVVFRPEDDFTLSSSEGKGASFGPRMHARSLRSEDVLEIWGRVERRPEGMVNADLPTGEIEVRASGFRILNRSEVPPFEVALSLDVSTEMRLRYRYLDIRNPEVMKRLEARHRLSHTLRSHLVKEDFLEVETPFLTKSTPEGARDYLVPSRVSPGSFYALPQSPQIFKQILMVAGVDRYFQFVRCFRDEDLRADRQPEFTQLDLEMAFVNEDDVLTVVEEAISAAVRETFGIEAPTPFPRMSYAEAMESYGTDRPDTRFDLLIRDITDLAAVSPFEVFRKVAADGGRIRGICVPGGGSLSRKQIDGLVPIVEEHGAKGLAWAKVQEEGLSGPIARHFAGEGGEALRGAFEASPSDLLLIVAGPVSVVSEVLGVLRVVIARQQDLIPEEKHNFLWVKDFPLLEKTPEGALTSTHHPFTSPLEEDLEHLEERPLEVRARAYDLVLNGTEVAGGSIRIHSPEVQRRVFRVLGISPEAAREKFGFLLDALSYGAPPHGGIAVGFDRLVAECLRLESIRDVIPFPKTTAAACPLTGAPTPVDDDQLRELGLSRLEREG